MKSGIAADRQRIRRCKDGFIESYKRLEKLCGDLLNDNRRISACIDEMISLSRGSYLVRDWDDDLKQLKHYRWVRNQIAHEPDCSEENMCEPSDVAWIDGFYSRIMNQTDPLAMYLNAEKPKQSAPPQHTHPAQKKPIGWVMLWIVAALVGSLFVLKYLVN